MILDEFNWSRGFSLQKKCDPEFSTAFIKLALIARYFLRFSFRCRRYDFRAEYSFYFLLCLGFDFTQMALTLSTSKCSTASSAGPWTSHASVNTSTKQKRPLSQRLHNHFRWHRHPLAPIFPSFPERTCLEGCALTFYIFLASMPKQPSSRSGTTSREIEMERRQRRGIFRRFFKLNMTQLLTTRAQVAQSSRNTL